MSSDENDDMTSVKLGEEMITLADLAGVDLDGVSEKRGLDWPICVARWRVFSDEQHEPPKIIALNGKNGDVAAAVFNLKCMDVLDIKDASEAPNGDPRELVGKIHRETQFITSVESIGYLKAFIVDIGGTGKGKLADQMLATDGLEFICPMQHRRDKDDKDRIYRSLNRNKIKAVVQKAA